MEVVHQEPQGKVFWLYKQLLIREGKKKKIIKQEKKSSSKAWLSKEKNVQKSREIKTDTTQKLLLKIKLNTLTEIFENRFSPSRSQKKTLKEKQETYLLGWIKYNKMLHFLLKKNLQLVCYASIAAGSSGSSL